MIVETLDAAAAIALCERALDLPEDAAEAGPIVHRLLDPPPGRRLLCLATAGGEGVLIGSQHEQKPTLGHIDLVAVRPEHRAGGHGRALLESAHERLASWGARRMLIGYNNPCYAWPGVDVRYTPAICTLLRLGYRRTDATHNMTVDLAEFSALAIRTGHANDEERLADHGVEVVPIGQSHVDWVGTTFEDGWGWEVGQSIGRPDAGGYVAVRDGQPLGFAAYGANRPSWFGPMGTGPNAERLGIGRVLLRRCLADQRAHGLASAQIGWVGPVPFYARAAGARVERIFWRYTRTI